MNNLERMKISVELMKVKSAKVEMEYIIAMREDEIQRVLKNIDVQNQRIEELEKLLKE